MQYTFGNYVLDTERYELHCAGQHIKLRRKVFQVLAYLLAHRDRVVSKQELLERLWPDQFVGDEALKSCIKSLRKTLGEAGRTPRFVHTLHGHGYRFVAALEREESPSSDSVTLQVSLLQKAAPTSQATMPLSPVAPWLTDTEHTRLAPLAEEHKQVTVLCGALAEPLLLARRLGPEAMHHLMQVVLALVHDTVQRYGGTISQVSGEGFLALFGAPLAQEDHARQAVLAALELRQQLVERETIPGQTPGVAMRLGLHTGPVVVGSLAYEPQRLYTALGHTLFQASAIQQAASDTILASADTYALVQDEVQGKMYLSVALDAASPSVPVYTIRALRQRRAGVPRRGARPPSRFVGRTQELALLQARLEEALSGQGQVIGIAGDPGLGKSRLLTEFAHSLRQRPVTYGEGHCLAYGSATPYVPVRGLLRQLWGLTDLEPMTTITTTVQQQLHATGVTSEEERLLLLQLMDVPVDAARLAALRPQERQARMFALLRHILRHTSQQQPLVIAVENLHWIDPMSEACLASLIACLGDMPLLIVTTSRPGYQPPWSGHTTVTQIALPRLSPRESLTVLQAMPGAEQLAVALQQAIVSRAAGNPFFVEELTSVALENGAASHALALPETVQAVLAARLDRLPAAYKRLMQMAAVIGADIPLRLLQHLPGIQETLLHSGMEHLQAVGLLYETQLFPEHVFTFKHALIQEVAYGSLLQEQRRSLHAQTMQAIETLYAERLHEQVGQLAHHALRGEVWDKALRYSRQAGAIALERSAYREAVVCFEQALATLQHLPPGRDTLAQGIDLRFDLRNALFDLGAHGPTLEYLRQAETLAQTLGDQRRLGRVCSYMTRHAWELADLAGAIASGQRALAIAADLSDASLQVATRCFLGQAHYYRGDYRQAVDILQHNVTLLADAPLSEHFGLSSPASVYTRTWLVVSLAELGLFAEALALAAEEDRIAAIVKQPASALHSSFASGVTSLRQGDGQQAIVRLEQALGLCQTWNLRTWFANVAAHLGYAYALAGRVAEAVPMLEQAVGSSVSITEGPPLWSVPYMVYLSEAYLLTGRQEQAIQLAARALGLAAEYHMRGQQAWILRLLGTMHAHGTPSAIAPAVEAYQQAMTLAEELGMRPLQAHCQHDLGMLYLKTGRWEQAYTVLSVAMTLYRALAMTFWLPAVEVALRQTG